jgi:glycopeptide antibiotics resistance protein
MFLRHPILSLATFVYLGVVGWVTLTPATEGARDGLLWAVAIFFERFSATEWITFNLLEFLANIAMFAPIGLFFVLLFGRRRWWLAVVLGVALTVGIEFTQQFIPNRVSDPRDIVANSLGSMIGVLVALAVTARKAKRIRIAQAALSRQ